MTALPPFDALIAFEAVLRNGSVTAAAKDLGITQSAASHRLRRLEAFMGTNLLARTGNGIKPTPAGRALADGLTELLGGLAELRARCRAATSPATLKVGVGSALADHWLVARLPRFAANHDHVAVEVIIVESHAHAQSMALDIQILWQPEAEVRSTSTQRLLFREKVFPVCHPALLPGDPSRDDPATLARLPIIHKGAAADGATGAEWSWPIWFRRLGITTAPAKGLRFNNIGTAIGAALQGSGVVLARSLLVQDALADGRLCRLLPETWDMPSSKVHLVRWPVALVGDPRVNEFVTWLVTEAKAIDRPATHAPTNVSVSGSAGRAPVSTLVSAR